MRGGPRAGLPDTAGVTTSEGAYVAAAASGLVALFEAEPATFTVAQFARDRNTDQTSTFGINRMVKSAPSGPRCPAAG